MADTLDKIAAVLEERKNRAADESYVAGLYQKGRDAILKKLGEEAVELLIAAKNPDKKAIIHEMADLWFHCQVLLADLGLTHADIMAELERRYGESGLKEKKNRGKSV